MKTRSRIQSECLVDDPLFVSARYTVNQCGNFVTGQRIEEIAQARAIYRLNKTLNDGSTGVSPRIQWELSYNNLRPDILFYDPTKTTN